MFHKCPHCQTNHSDLIQRMRLASYARSFFLIRCNIVTCGVHNQQALSYGYGIGLVNPLGACLGEIPSDRMGSVKEEESAEKNRPVLERVITVVGGRAGMRSPVRHWIFLTGPICLSIHPSVHRWIFQTGPKPGELPTGSWSLHGQGVYWQCKTWKENYKASWPDERLSWL